MELTYMLIGVAIMAAIIMICILIKGLPEMWIEDIVEKRLKENHNEFSYVYHEKLLKELFSQLDNRYQPKTAVKRTK